MADRDDTLQGLEFLAGARAILVGGFQVAIDEFDGLEEAAWGFRLPDFAESASTQALNQPIAGKGLGHGFDTYRHVYTLAPAYSRRKSRQAKLGTMGGARETSGEERGAIGEGRGMSPKKGVRDDCSHLQASRPLSLAPGHLATTRIN